LDANHSGHLSHQLICAGEPEPNRGTRRIATQGWRKLNWVVFAKPPFGGPAQVLAYLGRYTHRVAIANSRILSVDGDRVSFRWRDYRANGQSKIMTLGGQEFIRRFLQHTLPDGFHRIRHYGFLANGCRVRKISLCRRLIAHDTLLAAKSPPDPPARTSAPEGSAASADPAWRRACLCCGGTMRIAIRLPLISRQALTPRCDTS
jgi:hypothetical protein